MVQTIQKLHNGRLFVNNYKSDHIPPSEFGTQLEPPLYMVSIPQSKQTTVTVIPNTCIITVIFRLCLLGYTLEAQKSLFDNIRPLFANKPLMVIANKKDVWGEILTEEKKTIMTSFETDMVSNY